MINSTDSRKLNPKQQWRKVEESWEATNYIPKDTILIGIRNL